MISAFYKLSNGNSVMKIITMYQEIKNKLQKSPDRGILRAKIYLVFIILFFSVAIFKFCHLGAPIWFLSYSQSGWLLTEKTVELVKIQNFFKLFCELLWKTLMNSESFSRTIENIIDLLKTNIRQFQHFSS